ncbi:MAG TPA: hypothetical protein VIG08_02420 [Gemmatimonadales bacterium]|jgi:hypothetical protein
MKDIIAPVMSHEPDLSTIEMVCERLGELGLPVGPDTARELIRAVLQMESPRVEAQVRDALETSLETIRIAAQSAKGILAATERISAPAPAELPKPVLDRPYHRKTPAQGSRAVSTRTPPPKRRPGEQSGERVLPPPAPAPEPRRARDDFDGDETRPVFRRPRR